MTIISSIYIASITPSILKHAMDGLVRFVNFRGLEDNISGSTKKLKILLLHNFFNILSLFTISSLSN